MWVELSHRPGSSHLRMRRDVTRQDTHEAVRWLYKDGGPAASLITLGWHQRCRDARELHKYGVICGGRVDKRREQASARALRIEPSDGYTKMAGPLLRACALQLRPYLTYALPLV
ncbi:hypothetical protein NDU88_011131 [Pleurodeles waltl]|uniref:Uncharacterized protein n=1 Tax=Pleurodeles waltl TaxID=8319 RepID=A0AAV7Q464_PLEWA|nr:hypothetical protein NDU88_011131 [Pleurodeles waltl]